MTNRFLVSPDYKRLQGFSLTSDVRYEEAGSYGKSKAFKKRKYLLMHYTAGRGLESTVAHFKDPTSKVSAHLVVGRTGKVVQMVPFDLPAWHAGAESSWRPKGQLLADKGINFYSLGIEFDNYGPLTYVPGAKSRYRTWFGRDVDRSEVAEVDPKAPGSFNVRFWHAYPEEQLAVAVELAEVLCRVFKLQDVLGHSDVSKVKRDPGPLFPLASIRSVALGRM